MSEIVEYQAPSGVAGSPVSQQVAALVEWAEAAQAAHALADTLVKTSFVADSFKGKPGEATAAILAGSEIGLSPIAALRSFDVIQGQAAARALTLRAAVLARGHELELLESTETRCKMRGRRAGSEAWQEVVWTKDRAAKLGLLGKKNWQAQPQGMLVARATAELARLVAADAILGIPYAVEEIEDREPAPTVTIRNATMSTRRVSRRAPAQVPDEPELDDEPPAAAHPPTTESTAEEAPEPAAELEPELITGAQSKKLHALLRENGLDRDAALAWFAETLGRPVASSKELLKDEASVLINALDAAPPAAEPPAEDFPDDLLAGGDIAGEESTANQPE